MKSVFKSFKRFSQSLQSKVTRATSNDGIGPTNEELVEISIYTYNKERLQIIITILATRLSKHSEKYVVSITKTLTLILYLLQNGSIEFTNWIKRNISCFEVFNNLKRSIYPETVVKKAMRIIQLCQNDEEMRKYKSDIHKYRNDMNSPGIKRTSIELLREPEIAVEMKRTSKSIDIVRYAHRPLKTLTEESSTHSNNPFLQSSLVKTGI
jgi:hypothetical protein